MTDRKTELEEMAMRLSSIIETAIDGIITIDARGIIQTFNRAASQLFDYSADEVIGHNIKMLMPQPHHGQHDGYLARYHQTKEPRIIGIGREVQGLRKDGSRFDFRLAVSEVILNDRIVFTGIIHDLTAVKKAQEDLKKVNLSLEKQVETRTQELEDVVNELLKSNRLIEESQNQLKLALEKERELNQLKSRFVSMASHEFRTPLSTILSSASIISKYTKEDQQDNRLKHVDRIKSSVTNLTGILNDFLSLSKLEEGKVEVKYQEVNIQALCKDINLDVQSILKKGQVIKHDHEGEQDTIVTDPRILKNILFNLISNAIKYSPESTEIYCKMMLSGDSISIAVKDEGIGIPESEQQYLFERFFRATNVENIQGTGLGLNIVQRYVEVLNGEISFQSNEREGSTFTILLPIRSL